MVGRMADASNREPLWHAGFDVTAPLYTFIRTLGWYRWWMNITQHDQLEHFVDFATYAFSQGPELLVVLTAGPTAAAGTLGAPRRTEPYPLQGLGHMAGVELCDALGSGVSIVGSRRAGLV